MQYSREQKKWAAARRAQFALDTALRRIDYMEDVVKPELEAIAAGELKLTTTGDATTDARAALALEEPK